MTRYVILVTMATLCYGPSQTAFAEARTVTISIQNQTPEFTAAPSIEVFGSSSKPFTTSAPNIYEYKFPVSDSEWFDTVDIKVLWKNAYLNNDGSYKDFDQRVLLRIRRDFPSDFTFPIYFSNDRSQDEMSRLEHERDENEQFEVFFRGQQIATYYRDTFGPQHAFTKRAAKIFFYGAVKLAETPAYFVQMSDDAEQFIVDAFGGSSSYTARAELARSEYWNDLKQVDTYVAKGDCATARMILATFQTFKDEDPKAFAAQYGKEPTVLDDKAIIINSKCATANANSPGDGSPR